MALLPSPIAIKTDSGTTKLLLGAAGVGLGYWFVLKPWLEQQQRQSGLNIDQGNTIKPKAGKSLYNLNGKPIKDANLSTIVYDIYQGLHPGWYAPTDDARVVRAFKNTPFGYVKQVEQLYLDKYGENLRQTMADKLSDKNWINVKYWFV
jgi:hypothetical protein